MEDHARGRPTPVFLLDLNDNFLPLVPKQEVSSPCLCCPLFSRGNPTAFGDGIIDLLNYTKGKPIKISNSASSEFESIRPIFCSSVGIPNWTVGVDGSIYCCARDDAPDVFNFGRFDFLNHIVVLDDEKMGIIKQMNVLNYEECSDCFCKYHCAGDCPDRRLSHKSDCNMIRTIGTHVLNERINA